MRNGDIVWANDPLLHLLELTPDIMREHFPPSADGSGVWIEELFSGDKEAMNRVRSLFFLFVCLRFHHSSMVCLLPLPIPQQQLVAINITGELQEPNTHTCFCEAIAFRTRRRIPGVAACVL